MKSFFLFFLYVCCSTFKMTKLFLFLLLFLNASCFAQNSQVMFSRTNFDSWKREYSDSLYREYVELFKTSDWYQQNKKHYEEGFLEESISIVDFDQDGLNDIIYEGYLNGGESEHVVFLHRSLFGLEKIFDVSGYVVHVSAPNRLSTMQIAIKHYGCCEDVISNIEMYSLIKLEDRYSFVLTDKYAFVDLETAEFPTELFNSPIHFETVNPEYALRFTPEIDDTTQFTSYQIGNKTGIYPGGSIGVALAEKTDDSGRVWWFVYMKHNLEPLELYLHPGFNNTIYPNAYGWMSSRFLKRLE